MRVVLDTNILLSALISPHGVADTIFRAWRSAKFDLITSVTQLEELRRASRYPKFKTILQPARVGTMINNLQHAIILDQTAMNAKSPHPIEISDPNDAFLIQMSLAGNANYLVTGDKRSGLLQKKRIGQTRILLPSTFCSDALAS